MVTRWIQGVLCSLLIAGCGGDGDEETGSLEGTWQTGCQVTEGADEGDIFKAVFAGNTVRVTIRVHADLVCNEVLLESVIEGVVVIGDDVVSSDGQNAARMVLDYTKVFITLLDEEGVTSYNTQNICGHANWNLGNAEDVTDCPGFNRIIAEAEKDIFKIEGGKLYFGEEESEGADGYPTTLEDDFFTRS